ncbi:MAG: FUSC family protein [Candidatus Nanopelagicales bacterium]
MEGAGKSRESGQRRWWQSSYARLALLTAIAALAAYVIAEALPYADPIPAAITAAVATRAAFHHAAKETAFQILGALFGALIALAIVSVIGTGPFVMFLLVLLAFALARLLHISTPDESPFVAASISVTMILVVGTHFTNELALERFNGVVIGALCSLAASFFATSTKNTRLLRAQINDLQRDLGLLLADVATGLRETPTSDEAASWLDQAIALRNRALGLDATFEDLKSHRRWSPRIDPDDLEQLRRGLDAGRVTAARVLSIASDLTHAAGGSGASALPPAALSPLADLIALAAENIAAEDPATSVGATKAHEAVRNADQTAQIALIGGIVSHVNRINRATSEGSADDDPGSQS